MNRKDYIKKILDYIKNEHICVLSTSTPDGKPEAAAMAFSEMDDLSLIISTSLKTRKYKNLTVNPKVALVIGISFEDFITVQYEGTAQEAEKKVVAKVKKIHITKNEESKKYADSPDNRYFVITPKWIRYWDVRGNVKFELKF